MFFNFVKCLFISSLFLTISSCGIQLQQAKPLLPMSAKSIGLTKVGNTTFLSSGSLLLMQGLRKEFLRKHRPLSDLTTFPDLQLQVVLTRADFSNSGITYSSLYRTTVYLAASISLYNTKTGTFVFSGQAISVEQYADFFHEETTEMEKVKLIEQTMPTLNHKIVEYVFNWF